ncbi:uncharacterized protein [Periplaneta americana]|uniref:uncharacterized protein n=1 Tax=Periplaneta americana TaxID=6978 RepID=UPI0037E740FD
MAAGQLITLISMLSLGALVKGVTFRNSDPASSPFYGSYPNMAYGFYRKEDVPSKHYTHPKTHPTYFSPIAYPGPHASDTYNMASQAAAAASAADVAASKAVSAANAAKLAAKSAASNIGVHPALSSKLASSAAHTQTQVSASDAVGESGQKHCNCEKSSPPTELTMDLYNSGMPSSYSHGPTHNVVKGGGARWGSWGGNGLEW